MKNWWVFRAKESNGFVAKRLMGQMLSWDRIMLGSSFVLQHYNIRQYLDPKDVYLAPMKKTIIQTKL